ncbi:MAG: sugar phosphate isomerase/epimerase [Candidatus Omnitrophica bacterium]|nr:sugar phosphate isomerase/epimerase [Candidatus Omnitrophota bacterium]
MLIGLNGATIMKSSLARDIEVAGKAGYDCLEIWASKLKEFLSENNPEDLVDLFKAHRIKPLAVNSIENATLGTKDQFIQIKKECEVLCETASRIGCEYIVIVPGEKNNSIPENEIHNRSVKALRELSDIALRYNIKLAFEFLGFNNCSVNTLTDCLKIVESTARDNVGFVLDAFHFYTGASTMESLNNIDIKHLFIFHINDAEDISRADLRDANRLLPGDGAIPLKEILTILNKKGYEGPVSVELFRPEYWQWPPFELARTAKEKTLGLLEKAAAGFPALKE